MVGLVQIMEHHSLAHARLDIPASAAMVSIAFKNLLKGHWHPKFLLLISIKYTCGIFNLIFWPVCRG
jgi:hypothetical protein